MCLGQAGLGRPDPLVGSRADPEPAQCQALVGLPLPGLGRLLWKMGRGAHRASSQGTELMMSMRQGMEGAGWKLVINKRNALGLLPSSLG